LGRLTHTLSNLGNRHALIEQSAVSLSAGYWVHRQRVLRVEHQYDGVSVITLELPQLKLQMSHAWVFSHQLLCRQGSVITMLENDLTVLNGHVNRREYVTAQERQLVLFDSFAAYRANVALRENLNLRRESVEHTRATQGL